MSSMSGCRVIAERIIQTLPHQTLRSVRPPFSRTTNCLSNRALTSLSTPSNGSNTLSDGFTSPRHPQKTASQMPAQAPQTELSNTTPAISTATTYVESNLDSSVSTLLPLLRAQSSYYAQIYIQGHPYLITAGDSVRLPFVLQNVQLGDVIRLNRATVFGSRDYTLKAPATARGEKQCYLDERSYIARATVVNVVYEPLRVKIRKYPRNRHARHFFSKHSYTVLRISDLRPASEDEWKAIQEQQHQNGEISN